MIAVPNLALNVKLSLQHAENTAYVNPGETVGDNVGVGDGGNGEGVFVGVIVGVGVGVGVKQGLTAVHVTQSANCPPLSKIPTIAPPVYVPLSV